MLAVLRVAKKGHCRDKTKDKKKETTMKENDGKAARRTLYQRVGVAVLLMVIVVLVGLGTTTTQENSDDMGYSRHWMKGRRRSAGLQRRDIARRVPTRLDADSQMQAILRGERTLVSISVAAMEVHSDGSYSGLTGKFCPLSWETHKENPSSTPMFRDVVAASEECDSMHIDVAKVASQVRAYDANPSTEKVAHTLKIGGFVFHESRCGSTLVANLLQSAHPAAHRVYSESPPPVEIFQAAQQRFSPQTAAQAVRDVIFLMSRSNDLGETHVFFKIQSVGSRALTSFTTAFPAVPWIFVFRDSVEVLMSYFKDGEDSSQRAHCNRHARNPPVEVLKKFREMGKLPTQVLAEEYCAIHFSTLTESALASLEAPGSQGAAVEYTQLPDIMWNTILPDMFHIPLQAADIARMQETAGEYSKGRGGKAGSFTEDTARKQGLAHNDLKAAARDHLEYSYGKLNALSLKNQ